MPIRKRIEIRGMVQGVGFRPYVYRLAVARRLTGGIANTASGVAIEIQGEPESVADFLRALPAEVPPLARITDFEVREIACNGDHEFRIHASEKSEAARALIPPDIAVCDDCLRELFDPADRRYLYPFINCTNCGPRFTIVRSIPYDRPQTSMAAFEMCARCRAEYDDPENRRFHAQPNACWDCGPQAEFQDARGERISCDDPIGEAAARLRAGAIVAVKGLGGFHLAADATNSEAVEKLRERKHRVEKPFAVMVPDAEAAAEFCELDGEERELLVSPERPIVILRRKHPSAISQSVAPFNPHLGIFLPYTPVHHRLFAKSGLRALVMTSGNVSEEPIAIGNAEAVARLAGLADFFLVHTREILRRCDDSVLRRSGGCVRQLRRSRGFVPVPVFLDREFPSVLAVGGELKNTICLLQGRRAFLSQHIGDLENAEAYNFFGEAVAHWQNILDIQPDVVAYDLHPDYFSTRWALGQKGARKDIRVIGVQHHHAHIASCMAENHLESRVIGIALDGTGYGTDGRVWGGEILLADYLDFERAAHLSYVPMPGGAAAIREPWRMAASYLRHAFGPEMFRLAIPFVEQIPAAKLRTISQMAERGVNSPLTSSCGRLFDGVAALAGLRHEVNYEAQAAIELEACRDESAAGQPYSIELREEGGILQLDPAPVIRAIVEDLRRGATPGQISQRFHEGLACALADVARRLRERTGLNTVCLSGGSFQNVYLAGELERLLAEEGFRVFTHSQVPAGDGGLSLGQAVVAASRSEKS
jgi:hydrogenase maturation protein HypF